MAESPQPPAQSFGASRPLRFSANPRADFNWSTLPIPSPSVEEKESGWSTPPENHPANRGSITPSPESITPPSRHVSFLPDPDNLPRRYSELPGDMPPSLNPPARNASNTSSPSPSPPPLDRQQPPWATQSRPVSPAEPVPPLPAQAHHPPTRHIQVHPTPVPSRPTTPHRHSERASVARLPPNTTVSRHQSTTFSEKPLRSSNLRPRAESGAPSFTSTARPKSLVPTTAPANGGTFATRVFDAAKSDLLYDLHESTRMPWNFRDSAHGVLDLTTLLRMQQHVLQAKLVEQVKAMGDRGSWMEIGVGETMKDYCQVTRDMEYMTSTALRGPAADPFLITTTNPLESLLLEEGRLVAPRPTPHPSSSSQSSQSPLLTPRLPYMRRTPASTRRVKRLLAIFAAAIALLAPYLIVTLVPGGLARVLTTCIFVAVFALVCAGSEMSNARAAGATLAYAGALIIFVGVGPPLYWS